METETDDFDDGEVSISGRDVFRNASNNIMADDGRDDRSVGSASSDSHTARGRPHNAVCNENDCRESSDRNDVTQSRSDNSQHGHLEVDSILHQFAEVVHRYFAPILADAGLAPSNSNTNRPAIDVGTDGQNIVTRLPLPATVQISAVETVNRDRADFRHSGFERLDAQDSRDGLTHQTDADNDYRAAAARSNVTAGARSSTRQDDKARRVARLHRPTARPMYVVLQNRPSVATSRVVDRPMGALDLQ